MRKNIFAQLMSMDDATWQRHANPLSVWSRVVTGLPVLLGSVWSIQPMGWWSIPILSAALFWVWLNPRLFLRPAKTDNWASKVTFGERVWLNRASFPIPRHHAKWAIFLSIVAGLGFLIAVIGAYLNMIFPTVSGGLVSWFGKMWFCDRMVWLYEDTRKLNAEYDGWLIK
jgi:hypothetical protein